MAEKVSKLLEKLVSLTLLESRALVTYIEHIFEVSTATTNLSTLTPQTQVTPVEVVEEKTQFDIILTSIRLENKLSALKLVRAITSLGLKESKEIVENVPKLIKESVTKEEAEDIKKQFESVGAEVLIK